MADAGPYPFCENNVVCDAGVWWCSTPRFLWTTAAFVGVWFLLFYFAAFVIYPQLAECFKRDYPSKYDNEETSYWFANHVVSTIHAVIITAMVIPSWIGLISAPPQAQFSQPTPAIEAYLWENAVSADTAHVFLTYICFDFIAGFLHGLHDVSNAVHHIVFILFTLLVMYNCFFALGAVTLLSMEMSTIFLNWYSFWRNRLDKSALSVHASMVIFGCLFFLCRIVGLFALILYFGKLVWYGELEFAGTPSWHLAIIFIGLIAAFGLQLFWLKGIVAKILKGRSDRGSRELSRGEESNEESDEEESEEQEDED